MTSADISLYLLLFEASPTDNTKTGDSGTDENIENAVACDIVGVMLMHWVPEMDTMSQQELINLEWKR